MTASDSKIFLTLAETHHAHEEIRGHFFLTIIRAKVHNSKGKANENHSEIRGTGCKHDHGISTGAGTGVR
jgi:hypothetical protein